MDHDADPVRSMDETECWALLESQSFGRLAYAIGNHPEIVPINYCARDRRIYFRTAGGNKLFGVTVNHNVAFEIDDIRGEVARSVVVLGTAHRLEKSEDKEFVESLPLRPWIPTEKYNYVMIEAEEINGREFHMGPEPGD